MTALDESLKYLTEGHRLMDHGEPDRAYIQYLKAENANRRAHDALKEARKG